MMRALRLKAKTYEPRFERVKDVRCEDCEYNGCLDNLGFPLKNAPLCGHCSGGRINLLLWDEVLEVAALPPLEKNKKKLERLIAKIGRGRSRIVRPSETLDPYLIRKKG